MEQFKHEIEARAGQGGVVARAFIAKERVLSVDFDPLNWVATESRLKSVARAPMRAASRLIGTLASPVRKSPHECGDGRLRVRATGA